MPVGHFSIPEDRIVRIVVGSGSKERQVTGFRFSADRVLTVRHDVEGAEWIRVEDPDGESWISSDDLEEDPVSILWPRDGEEVDIDAVVLKTPRIRQCSPWRTFARQRWDTRDAWHSAGYPTSAPDDLEGFFGTAFACSKAGQIAFQTTVAETFVENLKLWGGVSGSPVFRSCRYQGRTLSGLIIDGLDQAKGTRLTAVCLPALFERQGFEEALLGEDRAVWSRHYVPEVARILEEHRAARRAIVEQLTESSDEVPDQPGLLATRLCCEIPLVDVTGVLERACETLAETDELAARSIMEAMRSILPAAYLHTSGEPPLDPEARRLELALRTGLMAEVVLAAAERRPVRVVAPDDLNSQKPRPELQLVEPPQLGIDPNGEDRFGEFVTELERLVELGNGSASDSTKAARYVARLPRVMPIFFPKDLSDELLPHPGVEVSSGEAQEIWKAAVELINQRIEAESRYGRYYFVAKRYTPQVERLIEQLQEHLKSVRVVLLRGEISEMKREEAEVGIPLHQTLRHIHRDRED